jgi:hypothetical protein
MDAIKFIIMTYDKMKFTSQYDDKEILNMDDLEFDCLELQPAYKLLVGDLYRIPITYGGPRKPFEFNTEKIIINHNMFYGSEYYNEKSEYALKVEQCKKNKKLFDFIHTFDITIRELISNGDIKIKHKNKKCKTDKYLDLIRHIVPRDPDSDLDDDSDYDTPTPDYIRFHLMYNKDDGGLKTKIYNKGELIEINKSTDLVNILKNKSIISMRACFSHLTVSEIAAYPRLYVSEINIHA